MATVFICVRRGQCALNDKLAAGFEMSEDESADLYPPKLYGKRGLLGKKLTKITFCQIPHRAHGITIFYSVNMILSI